MKKYIFLLTGLLIIIASCSKKHDPVPPANTNDLKTIVVEKDTLNVYVGTTRQMNITVNPTDYNKTLLKWTSSDTSVLTVTNTGLLMAKKAGQSIIKVTNSSAGISAVSLVTAVPALITDSLKWGLIAWYKFDNNTADSSGHGNNGILSNALTFVTGKSGNPNTACYFNGTGSFIQVKDNAELRLNNTSFTISFWLNFTDENQGFESDIISKRTGEINKGWCAAVTGATYFNYPPQYLPELTSQQADGVLSYGRGSDDGNKFLTPYVWTGDWVFCTIIYRADLQQILLYGNSTLGYVYPGVSSPGNDITADMFIGKNNSEIAASYFLNGMVDDLRIYNRALSQSELTKLYHLTP